MALKVAYLVNQYPAPSHSFIRREIAALESRGVQVVRFSIRRPHRDLIDSADAAEARATRVLLAGGPLALVAASLRALVASPGRWIGAFHTAVKLGRRSDRGVGRHIAYLAEACLLVRWLREEGNVRHVHAHFGTNPAAVAMLARMLGGPPYSFTVHGPDEFDQPRELSLAEKIARADAVVAVSEFGRSQLYRWTPHAHWKKVHVIRCGVDEAFLARGPQPIGESRRLVCVGRLAPQKGQLLILDAMAALAAEGLPFELVLAGDGPLRPALEERVRELGLDGSVRITGWISNDQVRGELLAARAMLLPSFAEGLPVVLMEALALGRPAITTYVAGIPELIEDGVNGWLVPAGSLGAMTRAIRRALETGPEVLARMGRVGARVVAERHDVNLEAERLELLFRNAEGPAAAPHSDRQAPGGGGMGSSTSRPR